MNEDISGKTNTVESDFKKACADNKLYQLLIPEYDILTSIPACLYVKNGFNETLTFHTDTLGNLNAFSYEVIDYQYLASLEKNPRKKRLLTTK